MFLPLTKALYFVSDKKITHKAKPNLGVVKYLNLFYRYFKFKTLT